MSETWVLLAAGNSFSFYNTSVQTLDASFISNGQTFSSIKYRYASNSYWYIDYDDTWVYDNDDRAGWRDEAYRTIVLDSPATGDLLTWLQANGTKQEETDIYTINLAVPNGINIKVGGKYVAEDIKVIPKLEDEKTITPSTSQQTATPEEGYIGLKKVIVNAIATEEKTQAASTSNVIVQPTSGKYLSKVTVTPTPSETKTVTPTSASQSVTPSTGKLLSKVTVNAVPTETKSVTPTKSAQTVTPTSGKFFSSFKVGAIPSDYVIPSGTQQITENGTYDVSGKANAVVNVPAVTEVATAAAMNALLVEANVGKYYKFTGTTDSNYTNGDLYLVEA